MPNRGRIYPLIVLIGLAMYSRPSRAQDAIPVHEEPRHRVVHVGDGFRVFDVLVTPGDTTLFHEHNSPMAYIAIDASPIDIQSWGKAWRGTTTTDAPIWAPGEIGWSPSPEPYTHRLTTVGGGQFRVIGVSNEGKPLKGTPDWPVAGVVERENAYLRISIVEITPGNLAEWPASPVPSVVILPTDDSLGIVYRNGVSKISTRGDFFVAAINQDHGVVNLNSHNISAIFVYLLVDGSEMTHSKE